MAKKKSARAFTFKRDISPAGLRELVERELGTPGKPATAKGNHELQEIGVLDQSLHDDDYYGEAGSAIMDVFATAICGKNPQAPSHARDLTRLVRENKQYFGMIEASEALIRDPKDHIPTIFQQTYVKLAWNEVRVDALHADKTLGSFICFGWLPVNHAVVYAPVDFVPVRTPQETRRALKAAPPSRGLPMDVLQSMANCGPSAVAAYLDTTCGKVIKKSPFYQEKERIPITPMLELLGTMGHPHESVKVHSAVREPSAAFGTHLSGLAFIQFTGPWDGHWSQEYCHTHWIAYDNGKVYDVNARQFDHAAGNWVPEKEWLQKTVPRVCTFHSPIATGHYIRNILTPTR